MTHGSTSLQIQKPLRGMTFLLCGLDFCSCVMLSPYKKSKASLMGIFSLSNVRPYMIIDNS
jgi:hypothetical protein